MKNKDNEKITEEQLANAKRVNEQKIAQNIADASAKAPAPAKNKAKKTDAADKDAADKKEASKGEKALKALGDSVKDGKSSDAWVQQSIDMQQAIIGGILSAKQVVDDIAFDPLAEKLKSGAGTAAGAVKTAAGAVKSAAETLGNKIKNAIAGGEKQATDEEIELATLSNSSESESVADQIQKSKPVSPSDYAQDEPTEAPKGKQTEAPKDDEQTSHTLNKQ